MMQTNRTYQDTSQRYRMLTSIVANTFNYAVGRGLNAETISAATGLQRTDLINPETRLPEEAAATIWNLLSETYPGETLALHAASAAPLSTFGQLALAAQYAPDVRSALEAIVQYRTVLSDRLSIELFESGTEVALKESHPVDDMDGGYGAEAGLAILARLGEDCISGESPLVRVNFRHQPFGDRQIYRTFFGTPVYFQQPNNELVFKKESLSQLTRKGDIHLFRYIKGNLDFLQDHWRRYTSSPQISMLYDAIARNAEASEYSTEALAQQMNMSLRTLQRFAQTHNLTLRELLDNARQAKAKQLLKNPALQIEEISNRLGYSDERSFRRAFKRWTGQSPTVFRRK